MDLPIRQKLPHGVPQWVPDGSWFFITIKCLPPAENQLCRIDKGQSVIGAFAHNHEKLIWHCRLALLMPDHLHAILAFPPDPGLKATIINWKKFVARKFSINWQRDFFDHRLRNDSELQEKTSYILMNPVRKGFCERIEEWPWIYRPANRPPPILSDR